MSDVAAERRLAAIAAVDLAGYSARTEADERAAVRAVEGLHRLVAEAAAEHGGRVFNTAGDGFMLEFHSVSAALDAAADIAAKADPPVRVGVHLGEVSVTARGDLLGHGVNVAARLQTLAEPGAVLVSDAARRALGGGMAAKLKPEGRVRLDKMSEVTAVFALHPEGVRRRGLRFRLGSAWPLAAALLVLVPLAGGGYVWWRAQAPETLKVAVGEFQGPGAGPAKELAANLPGELTALLTANQVPTVAPGGAASARLRVEGDVSEAGPILRVRARLIDRKAGLTLWSKVTERPAAEADSLMTQASGQVADIVGRATRALGSKAGQIDPGTLAAFLKLFDQYREGVAATDANVELERQIVAAAPEFPEGHANLAYDLAVGANGRPSEAAAKMRAEAQSEAEAALKLDPSAGDAYAALVVLSQQRSPTQVLAPLPGDLTRGESLVNKALATVPNHAGLNYMMGYFLRGVGRVNESGPFLQRSVRLDPYSPPKVSGQVFALAGQGRWMEAKALSDRAVKLFPDYPTVKRAAAYTAILYGPPEDALAAIDAMSGPVGLLDSRAAELWRDYVQTARRGRSDPAVLERLAKGAEAKLLDPSTVVSALSLAGDLDAAFRVANAAFDDKTLFYTSNFFEAGGLNLRRDPRFIALAARLGLWAYWRKSGHWPDFCADAGLRYDCKAAAIQGAGTREG